MNWNIKILQTQITISKCTRFRVSLNRCTTLHLFKSSHTMVSHLNWILLHLKIPNWNVFVIAFYSSTYYWYQVNYEIKGVYIRFVLCYLPNITAHKFRLTKSFIVVYNKNRIKCIPNLILYVYGQLISSLFCRTSWIQKNISTGLVQGTKCRLLQNANKCWCWK